MPFRSTFAGNLHVVRWMNPTATDANRMVEEVTGYKRSWKHPLHGLALIGEDVPAPDDAARKAMGDAMKKLLDEFESMHVVVEGRGFKNTILRSAMTGIVLLGGKRGKVKVHGTVSEAVYAISEITEQSVESINRQLRQAELIGP